MLSKIIDAELLVWHLARRWYLFNIANVTMLSPFTSWKCDSRRVTFVTSWVFILQSLQSFRPSRGSGVVSFLTVPSVGRPRPSSAVPSLDPMPPVPPWGRAGQGISLFVRSRRASRVWSARGALRGLIKHSRCGAPLGHPVFSGCSGTRPLPNATSSSTSCFSLFTCNYLLHCFLSRVFINFKFSTYSAELNL